jgi:hypothetical protein
VDDVTRRLTRRLIEQGEPTDTGEWHSLDIQDLIGQGWQYIEFHYPDGEDDQRPDHVRLLGPND